MSRGPESKIVRKIKEAILEEYPQALVWKIHGSQYQEAGIQDLVCCINSYFFAFEVKQPGKESTPIQIHMKKRVLKAGGTAARVTSPTQVMEIIKNKTRNYERKDTSDSRKT